MSAHNIVPIMLEALKTSLKPRHIPPRNLQAFVKRDIFASEDRGFVRLETEERIWSPGISLVTKGLKETVQY